MPVSTSRVKQLWPWLVEARFAGLALGVIAVAIAVALQPHTPEYVIRLTGLVLQLLGIGTVIWGISETRALFGHASFASKAKSWLKRFPLRRKKVVLGAGATSHVAVTCKGRGFVTQGPGPNPTVETRIVALEGNISLIHERISGTEKYIDEEFSRTAEALKIERQERHAEDNAIRENLEATGTGGVHISAIGASWLFVGVILSTAGVEIAEFLK